MKKSNLRNIDLILKAFKKECKTIIKVQKYDAISMECSMTVNSDINDGITEAKEIIKSLNLKNISIEENKDKNNVFLIQFPELIPEFTTKEIEALYDSTYERLYNDLLSNDINHKVTKDLIIKNKGVFIKQAIISFYNSNVNKYQRSLDNMLKDKDIWEKAETLFLTFINKK